MERHDAWPHKDTTMLLRGHLVPGQTPVIRVDNSSNNSDVTVRMRAPTLLLVCGNDFEVCANSFRCRLC